MGTAGAAVRLASLGLGCGSAGVPRLQRAAARFRAAQLGTTQDSRRTGSVGLLSGASMASSCEARVGVHAFAGLERGVDEECLHKMLRFLFVSATRLNSFCWSYRLSIILLQGLSAMDDLRVH